MRPFIAQLAERYQQTGWVANTAAGLQLAIEGDPDQQQQLLTQLKQQPPAFTEILNLTISQQPLVNYQAFEIKASLSGGPKSATALPDIATCPDCQQELFDPNSRFYQYPFTSCSHCGPRYSIMTSLPYDRIRTSMAEFSLCPSCTAEYRDSTNRRFHAQTMACVQCGPSLSLVDAQGSLTATAAQALSSATQFLKAGKILAVKGIGGFQLLVDASNQVAVERLRLLKQRPHKPLALMVADISAAEALCAINTQERQALLSAAAPIVLLQRRAGTGLAEAVAPGLKILGVMLAYTPLHHLLLAAVGKPLVATSGNLQDEPLCIDNAEALSRLGGIADYFLWHNRAILRPLDDSVVRMLGGKLTVLRRARGYVPLPFRLATSLPSTLALGGQLKNTIAFAQGQQVIVSQHLGDMENELTQQRLLDTVKDMQQFFDIQPSILACDLHRGYSNWQLANTLQAQLIPSVRINPVAHHYAHILSCMAEHGLAPPLLGIAWDGNGLGIDNTLWGGEFLRINQQGWQRYACLRSFPLPGGHLAMREPRRTALGVLYALDNKQQFSILPFSNQELALLSSALDKQLNCPVTSSCGRLFDAVASFLQLCQRNDYEGQAAMLLEQAAQDVNTDTCYAFSLQGTAPVIVDWQATIEQLLRDLPHYPAAVIARKFHNTLAEILLTIATQAGEVTIVLSGGCFQNALLVDLARSKLTQAGFNVYCHEKIPPNDGGLALGQVYATQKQ